MVAQWSRMVAFAVALMVPVWVAADEAAAPPGAAATAEEQARNYFTDLPLVTQDGQQVRFYSDVLKDKVVLINFIFTHCEDACPLLTRKLIETREALGDALGDRLRFVSISIDPQRDTPQDLKAFAARMKVDERGWMFLTGRPDDVNLIVKKLGQYTEEVADHSTLLLAGNVSARHWMKIPPVVPPAGIAEQLRMLAEGG